MCDVGGALEFGKALGYIDSESGQFGTIVFVKISGTEQSKSRVSQ
jgi:hypothetical protein